MSYSNSSAPSSNPARNGHMPQGVPPGIRLFQPTGGTWPTYAAPPTPLFVFPHVASREEGLAAPGDTVARPDHPAMGGVLYAASLPARDSRYALELTRAAYTRFAEDSLLRAAGLQVLQDDARHGTQIARELQQTIQNEHQARARGAQEARTMFLDRAAAVASAKAQGTLAARADLKEVEAETARVQYQAMQAHCRPGVPRADAPAAQVASPMAKDVVTEQAANTTREEAASSEQPKRADAPLEGFSPAWIKACKGFLGAAVGLAFGISKHFLSVSALLRFETATLVWMAGWILVGCAAVALLTTGLDKWWEYAGERRAEEPPVADVIHWRALRHAVFPTLITSLVAVMEASLLRSQEVSSLLVRDPGNWMYLVANLALILPATLYAGANGWTRGYTRQTRELRAQREIEALTAAWTRREETIVASEEAQTAFALDAYVTTLQARRDAILTDIQAQGTHYETLLSHYVADMEAPRMLTDDENRRIDAAREDAKAANKLYKQKHTLYEDVFETLPATATLGSLTLCFVRATDGELPPSPPAPKLSRWQRLRAFLGWVGKRLTRRAPGRASEQTS